MTHWKLDGELKYVLVIGDKDYIRLGLLGMQPVLVAGSLKSN